MTCRCKFCADIKRREFNLRQQQCAIARMEPREPRRGVTVFKLSRPLPSARMQWDDLDTLTPSLPWLQQKLNDHMKRTRAAVTSKVVTEGT